MRSELFLTWFGETTIACSALVALILLIRKPFTAYFGSRAAYALWLAPAFRLFLPELKLLPAPQSAAETAVTWTTTEFVPTALAAPAFQTVFSPEVSTVAVIIAAGAVVWAMGAFAWISSQLETQRRFLALMRERSAPAPERIRAEALAIAPLLGLHRLPEIRVMNDAAANAGPCVAGLLRATVFLPAGFEDQFTLAERRLAIAHELSHVARGDLATAFIAMVLRAAQWPNPMAHIAWRSFRLDQEAACDAFVLARCSARTQDAGEYAAAIMKSVRIGNAAAPAFGLSLSHLALAHPVKERLMLLKKSKTTPLRLLTGVSAAALLTLGGLAATASYGYAAEKSEKAHKTHRSVQIISADSKETLLLNGKKIGKYAYTEENGVRTLRVYDVNGKQISEDVYGPGDEMPETRVTFTGKDGETSEMVVGEAPPAPDGPRALLAPRAPRAPGAPEIAGSRRILVMKDGDLMEDFEFDAEAFPFEFDSEFSPEDAHRVMVFRDSDGGDTMFRHEMFSGGDLKCATSDDDGTEPVLLEWTDDDGTDGRKEVSKHVICLTGDDAKPERRAEALRKVIANMEADAKREAARRDQVLAHMREALKKAEKDAKK